MKELNLDPTISSDNMTSITEKFDTMNKEIQTLKDGNKETKETLGNEIKDLKTENQQINKKFEEQNQFIKQAFLGLEKISKIAIQSSSSAKFLKETVIPLINENLGFNTREYEKQKGIHSKRQLKANMEKSEVIEQKNKLENEIYDAKEFIQSGIGIKFHTENKRKLEDKIAECNRQITEYNKIIEETKESWNKIEIDISNKITKLSELKEKVLAIEIPTPEEINSIITELQDLYKTIQNSPENTFNLTTNFHQNQRTLVSVGGN